MSVLRAGFARRDITPRIGSPSGLTLRVPVDEVWDPLSATALVIEADGRRVALVGLDLMGLLEASHRSIREAVSAATGIGPDHVVLNVSHTHSGPYLSADLQAILRPLGLRVVDDDFEEQVREAVVGAVTEAANRAIEVTIRVGRGPVERVAANRRPRDGSGRVVHRYGRAAEDLRALPEGLIDPEVAVVEFAGPGGRAIGAVLVYACHPTAAGSGDHAHVSADFVGHGRAIVEAAVGYPCLFLQGCAGDQGTGKWIAGTPREDTAAMGRRLAQGATAALEAATRRDAAAVALATARIELALDQFPPVPELESRLATAAAGDDYGAIVSLGDALAIARRPRELSVAGITAIAVGDVALVVLPGEVFVAHGLAIRAGSPFADTIVAAYNDNTLQYIPTETAFGEGAYEVDGGWRYIRPGEGERIVTAAIAELGRLRAGP